MSTQTSMLMVWEVILLHVYDHFHWSWKIRDLMFAEQSQERRRLGCVPLPRQIYYRAPYPVADKLDEETVLEKSSQKVCDAFSYVYDVQMKDLGRERIDEVKNKQRDYYNAVYLFYDSASIVRQKRELLVDLIESHI